MRKKQKGGILPLLMLMNAMKGGGIKKEKELKSKKAVFLNKKAVSLFPIVSNTKVEKDQKGIITNHLESVKYQSRL